LKAFVGEPGVAVQSLQELDNTRAAREVVVDSGTGREFLLKSRNFRDLLDEVVKDPVTRIQIGDHLTFAGEVFGLEYGGSDITESPLIRVYYKNGYAARGIALSEYTAIAWLMHQR
jgi:hypothetical protein